MDNREAWAGWQRVGSIGLLVALVLASPTAGYASNGREAKPRLGQTFVLKVIRGHVDVRPTPDDGYGPVTGTQTFPVGAEVDATHGAVRLVVAANRQGAVNHADVTLGAFELTQEIERARQRVKKTHLRMVGGDFRACSAASASRKKKRPGPRRQLGVDKHGPIVSDDDRATGQTSGSGTSWIVSDYCDHTEIRAVSGRVERSLSRAEVAPVFRTMLPGDRALESCGPGTGAETFHCLLLFDTRARGSSFPSKLKGKRYLTFQVGMGTFESRGQVCIGAPSFAELCVDTDLTPSTTPGSRVRFTGISCAPSNPGSYSFRVLVGGVQVGPRLTTTVTGPLANVNTLEENACSPRLQHP